MVARTPCEGSQAWLIVAEYTVRKEVEQIQLEQLLIPVVGRRISSPRKQEIMWNKKDKVTKFREDFEEE